MFGSADRGYVRKGEARIPPEGKREVTHTERRLTASVIYARTMTLGIFAGETDKRFSTFRGCMGLRERGDFI